MNVTFLSPIFPTDLKRQSLPFSYLDISVISSDGNPHDVQLYTDITAGKCDDSLVRRLRPPRKSIDIFILQNGHLQTALLLLNGNTA